MGRRPHRVVVGSRLARPDARRRRRARAAASARRPGEVAVHESTTVGIFQLLNVALDLVPGPPGDRRRRRRLPDRPVRRRGRRPTPRRRDPPRDRRPRRRRRGASGRWSTTAPPRSPTWQRRPHGRRRPEPRRSGTCRTRPVCSTSTCTPSASSSPSGARTSSSTAGPAHRRSCTWRDHLHDRIVQPIWGWFGQIRPVRHGASVRGANRDRPDAQRHAPGARPDGGPGGDPPDRRGRHRSDRGQGTRRSPVSRSTSPMLTVSPPTRRATRRGAADTSPSAIPTRGGCMPASSNGRSSSTTATPTCCASDCRR